MPLKPFRSVPKDLREWSSYFDGVTVTPNDLSVSTAKIANNAVTYAKIQNVSDSSLIGRGPNGVGVAQEITLGATLEFAANSIVRSALTGDVTSDAGSNALLIPNDTVTFAKLQNVNTARLLGRTTAASGDIEEISVTSPLGLAAGALTVNLTTYAAKSTGTYTGVFTGCTSDPAPVIRYSVAGSIVVLYLPQTNATSNDTAFTITGAPAGIRPTRTQTVTAIVKDNGSVAYGTASMGTGGTLTLGLTAASAVFTNSGSKGIELQSVTYSLD